MKRKKVLIFGSTGSVGKSTLEIIRQRPDLFEVIGLCGNKSAESLAAQVNEFRPAYACLKDLAAAEKLKKIIGKKAKICQGQEGLEEFSKLESDISVMAISGIDCLKPLLLNIPYSRRIALANKETVVAAADFIFSRARENKTEIIPVDSEINAIFQIFGLIGPKNKIVDKVYLTASGGALWSFERDALERVTPEQVLKHPTWSMGKRITVDSATLVNKGFELVEVHQYFNIDYDKIEILLHRQSLIHAVVKLKDQVSFSCMYPPDMKKPLSFALFYPERMEEAFAAGEQNSTSLSCQPMPCEKFPLLKVIIEAARRRDNSLIILNAADEVVVDYFLKKRIRFLQIEEILKEIFRTYPPRKINSLEDVYFWDEWARNKTEEILKLAVN